MADTNDNRGAPPREVHVEKKAINWLAWIALAAGILALIYGIVHHSGRRDAAPMNSVQAAPRGVPGGAQATALAA